MNDDRDHNEISFVGEGPIVLLISAFRNAEKYLERYENQVWEFGEMLGLHGGCLDCHWIEGDSTDETEALLHSMAGRYRDAVVGVGFADVIRDCHGGPDYGSVDKPERWEQICGLYNRAFFGTDFSSYDAVVLVESDLEWNPGDLFRLLSWLEEVPAVAPMVWHRRRGVFYDIHGFVIAGVPFTRHPPHHQALKNVSHGGLLALDTAGSCIVMKPEVADAIYFDPKCWHPGPSIYGAGYSLWLDPGASVIHP